MPQPPEAMKLEKWFAGTWHCKGQQHEGPLGPEMTFGSRLEMKLELGGFWLQIKATVTAGPQKGQEAYEGFAGHDGTRHQRYDFHPGAVVHFTASGWEGDKLVFDGEATMGGRTVPMRHTITRKGDDQFSSLFESEGKIVIEDTCTRVAAAKK